MVRCMRKCTILLDNDTMMMICDKFKSNQAHSLALFSMSAITTLNPKAEVARAAAALHVSAPCCFEITNFDSTNLTQLVCFLIAC